MYKKMSKNQLVVLKKVRRNCPVCGSTKFIFNKMVSRCEKCGFFNDRSGGMLPQSSFVLSQGQKGRDTNK